MKPGWIHSAPVDIDLSAVKKERIPAVAATGIQKEEDDEKQDSSTNSLGKTPPAVNTVSFSLLTHSSGAVGKWFSLDKAGNLQKGNAPEFSQGEIKTVTLLLSDLPDFFAKMQPNQIITLGVKTRDDATLICTKGDKRIDGISPWVARSKEHLVWSADNRLVLLDIDKWKGTRQEMQDALYRFFPELKGIAHIIRPSSSSCLYKKSGDVPLAGEQKWHVLFACGPTVDIGGLRKILMFRSWLHDLGYYEPDKKGNRKLEYHFFDQGVFSPERAVFEGPAALSKDIYTTRDKQTEYIGGDVPGFMPTISEAGITVAEAKKQTAYNDPALRRKMDKLKAIYSSELRERGKADGRSQSAVEADIEAIYRDEGDTVYGSRFIYLGSGNQFTADQEQPAEQDWKKLLEGRQKTNRADRESLRDSLSECRDILSSEDHQQALNSSNNDKQREARRLDQKLHDKIADLRQRYCEKAKEYIDLHQQLDRGFRMIWKAGDLLWYGREMEGLTMLDPHEPAYQQNSKIAKFYASHPVVEGRPGIFSFAHHGAVYPVTYDMDYLSYRLGLESDAGRMNKNDIQAALPALLLQTEFKDEGEEEVFRSVVKDEFKIPTGAYDRIHRGVKAKLKAQEAAAQTLKQQQAIAHGSGAAVGVDDAVFTLGSYRVHSGVDNHSIAGMHLVKDMTVTEAGTHIPPAAADGLIHVFNTDTGLWKPVDETLLLSHIGQHFDGKHCRRKGDYISVGDMAYSHAVMQQNSTGDFFQQATVGIPCKDFFIGVSRTDGSLIKKPYSADLRQTFKTSVNAILIEETEHAWLADVGIDAYGLLQQMDCPLFLEQVKFTLGVGVFKDNAFRQQVDILQMAGGALLTGSMYRTACALFCYGRGRDGKTTFFNLWRRFLDNNEELITSSNPCRWSEDNVKRLLRGARINIVGELDRDSSIPPGDFKAIIPGDTDITSKTLFRDVRTFRPRCGHVFGFNGFPQVADTSRGFWERVLLLEFPNAVPDKKRIDSDHDLLFAQEGEQILTWFMEGARRLAVLNYRFPESKRSEILKHRWKGAVDSVRSFIENSTCAARPFFNIAGNWMVGTELFEGYKKFCDESNYSYRGVTLQAFYGELESNGYQRCRSTGNKTVFHNPFKVEDLL